MVFLKVWLYLLRSRHFCVSGCLLLFSVFCFPLVFLCSSPVCFPSTPELHLLSPVLFPGISPTYQLLPCPSRLSAHDPHLCFSAMLTAWCSKLTSHRITKVCTTHPPGTMNEIYKLAIHENSCWDIKSLDQCSGATYVLTLPCLNPMYLMWT